MTAPWETELPEVGDQPADQAEVRRPADVGDRRDQDLARLERRGLVKGVRHPDDALHDAA